MQIGDVVHLHPSQSKQGAVYPGTVVYIHPRRRFYTVRFDFERQDGKIQSFRESFYFPERAGAPDYTGAATPETHEETVRQGRHYKKKRK